MTNAEQYSDVFTNINISPTSRAVALKAKGLLDLATGQPGDWESDGNHTSFRLSEQSMALQAFWDKVYDTNSGIQSDRLAITVMRAGLTIALERRRRDDGIKVQRDTLFLSENGDSNIYRTDHLFGYIQYPDSESGEGQNFVGRFQDTTAAMGLHRRVIAMRSDYEDVDSFETAVNY